MAPLWIADATKFAVDRLANCAIVERRLFSSDGSPDRWVAMTPEYIKAFGVRASFDTAAAAPLITEALINARRDTITDLANFAQRVYGHDLAMCDAFRKMLRVFAVTSPESPAATETGATP